MIGLALLVGVAGGVMMTAIAGARRTASAIDRFLAFSRPADAFVQGVDADAVRRLPQVLVAYELPLVPMAPPSASQGPDLALVPNMEPTVSINGETWTTVDKRLLVAGRRPRLDRPHEVAVSEFTAQRFGLRPGSRFTLYAYAPEQRAEVYPPGPAPPVARGPAITFTVTGLERRVFDVFEPPPQDVSYFQAHQLYLTPAFWREYRDRVANVDREWVLVGLRRGAVDGEAFKEAVRGLPGGEDAFLFLGNDSYEIADAARAAVRAGAIGLYLFATLVGAVAILILGQVLAHELRSGAAHYPTMMALGMTRRQVRAVALYRAGAIAVIGALIAVVVAVLASPLMPVGLARRAEVQPGVAVDAAVLAAGVVLMLTLVSAVCLLVPGRRRGMLLSQLRVRRRASPSLADRIARAGLPPAAVTGVRMAVARSRTGAAPGMRKAVVGTAASTAAIVIVLVFAASLDRLVTTPRLQGWNWDVLVGDPLRPDFDRTRPLLAGDPTVAEYSAEFSPGSRVTVAGKEIRATAVSPLRGSVFPTLLAGRGPRGPGEVALASATLRRSRSRLGDEVLVTGVNFSDTFHVVGEIIYPAALDDSELLDDGAVLAAEGLGRVSGEGVPSRFLVRFAPGTDRAVAVARLKREHGNVVVLPFLPYPVQALDELRDLPYALTALLATIGLGTLIHALVVSVRRRRRDLAILKTIGFTRRQVSVAVAWQATTALSFALALGLPIGLTGGRWAWGLLGGAVGASTDSLTPVVSLLVVVVAVIVAGNAVAALPARGAARIRPASILRAE